MRKVFADTLYWLAVVKPDDPYGPAAREARRLIGPCLLVTTDKILYEFITALSRGGSTLRERAVQIAGRLLGSPSVKVVAQSRESLLGALERFSKRLDKQYSLTDCSSMNVMDAEEITEVLTHDHHFEQEGYRALMRAAAGGKAR
jgi:uncharacterized protein